ncbi:MAG: hypothetical protein ACYDDF_07965 [Thermoplasmatota archaeon]
MEVAVGLPNGRSFMLASCDNCANRKNDTCSLLLAPRAGEVLCERYAMSPRFRAEVLDLLRTDIEKQVNSVFQRFRVEPVDITAAAE